MISVVNSYRFDWGAIVKGQAVSKKQDDNNKKNGTVNFLVLALGVFN